MSNEFKFIVSCVVGAGLSSFWIWVTDPPQWATLPAFLITVIYCRLAID